MKSMTLLAGVACALCVPYAAQGACDKQTCDSQSMNVSVKPWGTAPDGSPVELYTLANGSGFSVSVSTYGATVVSIVTPDKNGKLADVVLGFDDPAGYAACSSYQGAGIGRYGNRIGGSAFTIDGKTYHVTANENGNSLHGGKPGYDKVMWKGEKHCCKDCAEVKMTRLSPDGENGYPGNLEVSMSFKVTADNSLVISYEGRTDKATPVNLTHHMYYNLSGDSKKDILGNVLTMDADRMTPVDAKLIPTGKVVSVEGTPFDFRKPASVGARVDDKDAQLKLGGGYDHNFVFTSSDGTLKKQIELFDPESGRAMDISTTEPAVQFYSGNALNEPIGKNGIPLAKRHGLCLETQHYPDSPNHPNFPSTILQPGKLYSSVTVLHFFVK
jgi:aldose 1-epimerase